MTPSRTVTVGSALPLLFLVGVVGVVGLVGIPVLRPETGPGRPPASSLASAPLAGWPVSISAANASTDAATGPEASALGRLRSSLAGGRQLGFSGTELVRSWRAGGSASQLLSLVQRPGGPRIATVQTSTTTPAGSSGSGDVPGGDPLTALSARSITALAAGYELRLAGRGTVAGRPATLVTARRDGRDRATMWLDDATGLLLRQDVVDAAGRPRRTAAFLTFHLDRRPATATPAPTVAAWAEVPPAELARWQSAGWPCPPALAQGFVLLDARRGQTAASAPVLQLVYGDGLSAISVFVQQGELAAAGPAGMTPQKWGSGTVLVRGGWPEVLVWQGDESVITAVGDDDPAALEAVLTALPRQRDRGALSSLQHGMGSALAWFKD